MAALLAALAALLWLTPACRADCAAGVLERDGLCWSGVDLWTELLAARRGQDRQEALLHREHLLHQDDVLHRANLSQALPERMEIEADDDDDISEQGQSVSDTSQRDQAVARAIGPYITPIANKGASRACLDHSIAYLTNIFNKPWALRMFDATGKLPDGILQGNLSPFGNWDECLNTTASINSTDVVDFSGKYCMAFFINSDNKDSQPTLQTLRAEAVNVAPILPSLPTGLYSAVGVCIPSTCTSEELSLGLNLAFQGKPTVTVPNNMCYTKDDKRDLSSADVVMIVILSLTGFLMLAGTVVDVVVTKARQHTDSVWSTLNAPLQKVLPMQPRRVFLAFSVYTNGRKLLDTTSTKDTLTCLHGIRFLSNTWVILGHTYAFITYYRHQNLIKVYSYFGDPAFEAIANATVSVDSFFFLSGLLVSYIAMRGLEKTKGKFNIAMFYVHRYIRLTPVMMMIIGFVATLYIHLGSGPWWGTAAQGNPLICQENWWQNLLYVNNLIDTNRQCVGQTWYLANDMQMFIFSPLVLLPLYHRPVLGQLWLILLVCFFTGINAMITVIHKLGPNGALPGGDDYSLRYMKPWTRAGPYLVGLYTGWALNKIRGRKIHMPAPVVAIGWLASSLTGCLIVYGVFGLENPSKATSVVYGMLNRTAWSVCLAWVVFACVTGYGGVINTLLSWKAFIPLSRLTYTSYLVSVDIQMYYWQTNRAPMYLDHTVLVYIFLGSLPVIFAVAACFSLAFESPMLALEKMIFPQQGRATAGAQRQAEAVQQPAVEPMLTEKSGVNNDAFEPDHADQSSKGAGLSLSAPECDVRTAEEAPSPSAASAEPA